MNAMSCFEPDGTVKGGARIDTRETRLRGGLSITPVGHDEARLAGGVRP
ncbi:MAG: hypothetical protein HY674_18865 [Chloroflexi bacterium]|nr:hypothetical protein [Chloroflexota bacterium]